MSRVTWDRDAEADLDDIWAAIAKDNAVAADRFIDTVGEKCRLLATHSQMGQLRPELAPNLRSFVVGNYVIFYRPTTDGIEVARVIHVARDVDTHF